MDNDVPHAFDEIELPTGLRGVVMRWAGHEDQEPVLCLRVTWAGTHKHAFHPISEMKVVKRYEPPGPQMQ